MLKLIVFSLLVLLNFSDTSQSFINRKRRLSLTANHAQQTRPPSSNPLPPSFESLFVDNKLLYLNQLINKHLSEIILLDLPTLQQKAQTNRVSLSNLMIIQGQSAYVAASKFTPYWLLHLSALNVTTEHDKTLIRKMLDAAKPEHKIDLISPGMLPIYDLVNTEVINAIMLKSSKSLLQDKVNADFKKKIPLLNMRTLITPIPVNIVKWFHKCGVELDTKARDSSGTRKILSVGYVSYKLNVDNTLIDASHVDDKQLQRSIIEMNATLCWRDETVFEKESMGFFPLRLSECEIQMNALEPLITCGRVIFDKPKESKKSTARTKLPDDHQELVLISPFHPYRPPLECFIFNFDQSLAQAHYCIRIELGLNPQRSCDIINTSYEPYGISLIDPPLLHKYITDFTRSENQKKDDNAHQYSLNPKVTLPPPPLHPLSLNFHFNRNQGSISFINWQLLFLAIVKTCLKLLTNVIPWEDGKRKEIRKLYPGWLKMSHLELALQPFFPSSLIRPLRFSNDNPVIKPCNLRPFQLIFLDSEELISAVPLRKINDKKQDSLWWTLIFGSGNPASQIENPYILDLIINELEPCVGNNHQTSNCFEWRAVRRLLVNPPGNNNIFDGSYVYNLYHELINAEYEILKEYYGSFYQAWRMAIVLMYIQGDAKAMSTRTGTNFDTSMLQFTRQTMGNSKSQTNKNTSLILPVIPWYPALLSRGHLIALNIRKSEAPLINDDGFCHFLIDHILQLRTDWAFFIGEVGSDDNMDSHLFSAFYRY